MVKNNNYSLSHDSFCKKEIYIAYTSLEGYNINPKVKKKDAIDVNKIIFISPDFREQLIRKKIDCKLKKILHLLEEAEEEDDGSGDIKKGLMEAEKLKTKITEMYAKYLGHTYTRLTLKKLQIIINQLKFKLLSIDIGKDDEMLFNEYKNEQESKRGR